MANFLHFSDYKRFIEDLIHVPTVATVAQLLEDFESNFAKDNPNFHLTFLHTLLSIYPEYDFGCEVAFLLEYDEDHFKDYANPRMEFIGQYLHYLSSRDNNDDKSSDIQRVPYDFEDEKRYVLDKVAVYGYDFPDPKLESNEDGDITEVEKDKPYTFGVKEIYKPAIEKIIENVDDQISISGDKHIVQKIAKILTAKDLAELSEVERSLHVSCMTNFFVLLLDQLTISFKGKINGRVFERLLIYTNAGNLLTLSNIYASRSRNRKIAPAEKEVIQKAISQHSPKN